MDPARVVEFRLADPRHQLVGVRLEQEVRTLWSPAALSDDEPAALLVVHNGPEFEDLAGVTAQVGCACDVALHEYADVHNYTAWRDTTLHPHLTDLARKVNG